MDLPYVDANGITWVTQKQHDKSIKDHQKQHGGEVLYLREVQNAFEAIFGPPAHNFVLTPVLHAQFDRGPATITYQGAPPHALNNHLYLVRGLGNAGKNRTMVMTEAWEVVHYAKQD